MKRIEAFMSGLEVFMSGLGRKCIDVFSKYMWTPLKKWVSNHLSLSIFILISFFALMILIKLKGWA